MKNLLEKILLRTYIPSDVIKNEIVPYFTFKDIIKTSPLNKYFNNECKKFLKNTKKIQKSFRQHRISKNRFYDVPFVMSYSMYLRFINIQKKELYYRYYIVHYPMEHLLNYPEYIVEKTAQYYDGDIREQRWNWIREKMPIIHHRTKRDVLNFFIENNISVKDFVNTGW